MSERDRALDYTVFNVTGPKAEFHICDPEGWQQKHRPIIAGARREQLITQKDLQRANVLPADTGIGVGTNTICSGKRCGCGRRVVFHRSVCDRCLSAKRRMKRLAS